MLAMQALLPSDIFNAGMFLAAVAAVLIAEPPGRLLTAGFAFAALLWTLVVLTAIGIAALMITAG